MQVVNERRAQPRAALTGAVVVFLGDEKIDCAAVDISASGIAVQSKVIRSPGQFLRVNFCLHDASGAARWYDADGVIARVARLEQGVLFGVQFLVVEARAARDIHEYVEGARLAAAAAQQREVYLRRIANGGATPTSMAPASASAMVPPDELNPPPVTGEFGPPARRSTAEYGTSQMPAAMPDPRRATGESSGAIPVPRVTGQLPRMPEAPPPRRASAEHPPAGPRRGTGETPRSGQTRRATGETGRATAETRRATGETRRATGETRQVSGETRQVSGETRRATGPGREAPREHSSGESPRAARETPARPIPTATPTRAMPAIGGAPPRGATPPRPVPGATPTRATPSATPRATPGGTPRADGGEPRRATPTQPIDGAARAPASGGRPTPQPQGRTPTKPTGGSEDSGVLDTSNVNLRALYRAALDEVDGGKGKKKKK